MGVCLGPSSYSARYQIGNPRIVEQYHSPLGGESYLANLYSPTTAYLPTLQDSTVSTVSGDESAPVVLSTGADQEIIEPPDLTPQPIPQEEEEEEAPPENDLNAFIEMFAQLPYGYGGLSQNKQDDSSYSLRMSRPWMSNWQGYR